MNNPKLIKNQICYALHNTFKIKFSQSSGKHGLSVPSQKADSPEKIWGKITNPTDQFIILCLIIFFSSLFIFITLLLLFLIIYFK
jgi:hypothetical protein